MNTPFVLVIRWNILHSTQDYFKEPLYGYQLAESRSESRDEDVDHGVTSGRFGIE